MAAIDIYKGGIKLGSGTATGASAGITGFTRISDRTSPSVVRQVGAGRNVTVVNAVGRTMATRVLVDGGSTALTLSDKFPYAT